MTAGSHQSRWSVGRNSTSLTFIRSGWASAQSIPRATSSAPRNSTSPKEASLSTSMISGSTWEPSSDRVGPGSGSRKHDAGGVHQDIHAAEGLLGASGHRFGLGVIAHVGGQGDGLSAPPGYLLLKLLESFGPAGGEADSCAGGCKRPGGGPPD